MPDLKSEETYYEILKIEPNASVSEIVAAYHVARNAFSKDSMATYSLLNQEDIQNILRRLDEAYQNLSDIDRRRSYDQKLSQTGSIENAPVKEMTEIVKPLPPPSPVWDTTTPLSGRLLCEIREKRALSLEDVARITRIPIKFLKAIEAEKSSELPARVFLQGFVKNLAVVYKLPSQVAMKSYLENLDGSKK